MRHLPFLAFLLLIGAVGCGDGGLGGGSGPKEVVRQRALEVARGASMSFQMDVSVTDLSASVDGNTAVVTGTMVAKYKDAPPSAGVGPFNESDGGFGCTGSQTTRKFRATCRKFDTGWTIEEIKY